MLRPGPEALVTYTAAGSESIGEIRMSGVSTALMSLQY
jgi:hypothetical protein